MPLSVTTVYSGPFTPNGVTTIFPFDFKALDPAEVAVTDSRGDPISGLDYSVEIAAEGGNVVFGAAPEAADLASFFIASLPTFEQDVEFTPVGIFNPRTLQTPFDRTAVRDAWLKDRIDRSIRFPMGEDGTMLPSAADRANRFAAFDSNGDMVVVSGSISTPALAANIVTDGGGNVQAMLDSSLQSGRVFTSVVTTEPGDLAGWVLTTTPTPGVPRDGLLIYHTMDDPSNGLHVLGYANSGCTGGQAGGFAMDGPGTGSASQNNRRGTGTGNGAVGNVVDEVDGFGLSGQFSSIGTGGAIEAIKQNSGVTGTAGTGPALSISNISDEGHALDSATSLNNLTDTSHRFTRLQREGINADFRMNNDGARSGALSVVRSVLTPGGASTGAGVVNAFEAVIGANITGSVEVNGLLISNASAGNTVGHGLYAAATGANTTNYGARFAASGGTNNIALRADGETWLLGKVQGSLTEYADDAAAAATLQIGFWYINSTTGAITSRRT